MWKMLIDDEIAARLERLDVPFNRYGLDRYGISREHVAGLISWLAWMYRHYFRVQTHGAAHIPKTGPGLLIGNHSGGIPVDAGMVLASLVLELDPPRLGHAMVEKFANSLPFLSQYYSRFGQFTGLPEHASRFLREGRLVVVFPEGVRGIGKYYSQRYQLERFGTGFMRIALVGKAPIIPFAFVGGEESYPVTFKLEGLGKLLGAPFIPIPRHLVPVPLPVMCHLVYGEPMWFDGTGDEADEVIVEYVRQVQARIAALIEQGRALRRASMTAAPPQAGDMP
jgi:1-acyl-sn-glycerol-3-phosphate acyltransferase